MSEELELRQISEYSRRTYNYPTLMYLRKAYPYLGIILATLSSLLFSLCSVIVKFLVDVGPIELAVFRFLGVLLPSIPIVLYKKEDVFPEGKRIILILRCIVGCLGLILSFYAFRYMNLADASVIIFSMPVFVAIFARLFLKEPCGLFHVVTIILTLIGVVLIAKPPIFFESKESSNDEGFNDDNYNIYGPISALGSTIFGANAITLLRALKGIHFSVVMSNFGFFSTIYTLLILFYLKDLCWPACGRDRWLILMIALFSFGGQILLTLALQIENAGPVSIGRSTDIVFAFIWQSLFFKESINFYSLLGAFLVVSCVFMNGFRKWLLALPRDSDTRKRFRLIAIEFLSFDSMTKNLMLRICLLAKNKESGTS